MASHPSPPVFPSPFFQPVSPIIRVSTYNMPVICVPAGSSNALTPPFQPSQVSNIIPGSHILTTGGIVMAMPPAVTCHQPLVVPHSLPSGSQPQVQMIVPPSQHHLEHTQNKQKEHSQYQQQIPDEKQDDSDGLRGKIPVSISDVPLADSSQMKPSPEEEGENKDSSEITNIDEEDEGDFVEEDSRMDAREEGDRMNLVSFIIEDSPSDEEDNTSKDETPSKADSQGTSKTDVMSRRTKSSDSMVSTRYIQNVVLPSGELQRIILPYQHNADALQHPPNPSGVSPAVYLQRLLVGSELAQQAGSKLSQISVVHLKPVLTDDGSKGTGSTKVCAHCGTTETPLWRRTPEGRFICNACGIYWKTNSCPRPVQRGISKRPVSRPTKTRDASCANCGTNVTSLWRRDQEGQTVCNACGLYYKLHKESRPIKLKKDHIKTRKRRCRGEDIERSTSALHNCHLPSSYSPLQSIASNQPSYVMMSSTPTKDQHSPASDNSVAMVTSAPTRPSMHQTPFTEV